MSAPAFTPGQRVHVPGLFDRLTVREVNGDEITADINDSAHVNSGSAWVVWGAKHFVDGWQEGGE
jgi:hypothetical protein